MSNELFRPIANCAVVGVTTLACVVAMALSVFPGVLNDLISLGLLFSLIVAPVVGLIALIAGLVLARRGRTRFRTPPWRGVALLASLLLGTYVMLKFYVPRRIAFAACRSSFERLVPLARPLELAPATLNRRIGVYFVDEYAADPRGGVYFRTYRGCDGIGPDVMSYGFAHRPNSHGTPFGAAHYELFRLTGDWCWFRASDDWF